MHAQTRRRQLRTTHSSLLAKMMPLFPKRLAMGRATKRSAKSPESEPVSPARVMSTSRAVVLGRLVGCVLYLCVDVVSLVEGRKEGDQGVTSSTVCMPFGV